MQERYVYPPGLQPPQANSPTSIGGNATSIVDTNSPNSNSHSRSSLQERSHHDFAELRSVASNNKMTGDSIKKGEFNICIFLKKFL